MPFAPRFTITNPITAALTAIGRGARGLEAATLGMRKHCPPSGYFISGF
jgi:hypothetical protein